MTLLRVARQNAGLKWRTSVNQLGITGHPVNRIPRHESHSLPSSTRRPPRHVAKHRVITVFSDHTLEVQDVSFSPDSSMVVTASLDGSALGDVREIKVTGGVVMAAGEMSTIAR